MDLEEHVGVVLIKGKGPTHWSRTVGLLHAPARMWCGVAWSVFIKSSTARPRRNPCEECVRARDSALAGLIRRIDARREVAS